MNFDAGTLSLKTPLMSLQFGTASSAKREHGSPLVLLNQQHSSICHRQSQWTQEKLVGDAHWTDVPGLELGVVTADCLPVLGFHEEEKLIFAAHVGWKGFQLRILEHLFEQILQSRSPNPIGWQVFLGPHIQFQSLEMELHLALKILGEALPNHPTKEFYFEHRSGYCRLNLAAGVTKQLEILEIRNITRCLEDTLTDLRFFSYRRQKNQAGRQISSIQMVD